MAGPDLRLAALRRFATAITVLNVAGYTLLGFEPAYAHPVVALATASLAALIRASRRAAATRWRARAASSLRAAPRPRSPA